MLTMMTKTMNKVKGRKSRFERFSLFRFWAFEEGDGGDGGSGSVTVEIPAIGDPPASKVDIKTAIPAELQEKEYFKNILKAEDPASELVKQFDNAQQLIGKKTIGVPAPDAPDEDWNKFFETTRPASENDYEIKVPEFGEEDKQLGEVLKQYRNDEYINNAKKIMHKWGLSKRQAEGIAKDMDELSMPMLRGEIQKQQQAKVELDKNFDKLAKEAFGGDKDKAITTGANFIKEFVTDTKGFVPNLPNEALMVMADVARNVYAKFKAEDSIGDDFGNSGGKTEAQLTAQIHELMAKPGYRNRVAGDHQSLHEQVDSLIAQRAKLSNKK